MTQIQPKITLNDPHLPNADLMVFRDQHVPRGWNYMTHEKINQVRYAVYHYQEKQDVQLPQKNWRPLKELNKIYYPLGHVGPAKDDNVVRILGYFPICGFWTGAQDIINSIHMIFKRVIKNANTVNQYEREQDDPHQTVFVKRRIFKADLSAKQRMAVLGLAVALFVRGVFTFCQIGCLFLPFDLLVNRSIKKA